MNKPPLTNLARMQTDGFKIAQMRENIQNENSFNRWLNSLRNQLEQEQKLRDQQNRAKFNADFPPSKSRASSKMTRRARSNSMPRYKSRSSTRSKTRSKPYSV